MMTRHHASHLLRSLAGESSHETAHLYRFMFWRSDCDKGEASVLSLGIAGISNVGQALEIANVHASSYRPILLATSGIVFLGSPLQGTQASTPAQWRAMLGGILNRSPSTTLLQDLDGHTKALRETTGRFLAMIRNVPMQTKVMCFWETQKTQILNAVLPRSITGFFPVTKITVGSLL